MLRYLIVKYLIIFLRFSQERLLLGLSEANHGEDQSTMDDEELMRLLMRTATLVRRSRHDGGRPGHGEHHHGRGPGAHGGSPHQRRGQGRVLATLSLGEGQSQKELANVLGIRPQSLSEILLKLEEEGMVERRKSPEDGRVMNVYLTDKGRERAAQAAEARKHDAEAALASLSSAEKQQLAAILQKLAAALEEE